MTIQSAARRVSSRSRVTSPMMRTASPGPGKGCRWTMSSGSPNAEPPIVNQQPVRWTGAWAMRRVGASRRVDAAGKRAEDPPLAYLFANRDGRLLDERGRLPAAATGRHLIEKVPDDLTTLRGMNHLRMEGDAKTPGVISHRRDQ